MPTNPFAFTSGPTNAQILIVGEAWGSEEAQAKAPFVGASGKELDRMLHDAGLSRDNCLCTNLVDSRPNLDNAFAAGFTLKAKESSGQLLRGLRANEALTAGYSKLLSLISILKPKLIIGTGNWPLWALTSHGELKTKSGLKAPTGIMNWRGSQTYTEEINGRRYPYLPIVHPAAILRQWTLRSITIHDLRARAARFTRGEASWSCPPTISNPQPSYTDATAWLRTRYERANAGPLKLSVDIETYRARSLVCIGLGDHESTICIPFFYFGSNGESIDVYSLDEEVAICSLLRKLLTHPNVRIIGQNFIYDAQFLFRILGIKVKPWLDTMLVHHLLWPGTPKRLPNLASLYCNHYCYWKDESEEWDTRMGHLDLWNYNCKDVQATLEIADVLEPILASQGFTSQWEFRKREWDLSFEMMMRGINYDQAARFEIAKELNAVNSELASYLRDAVPQDVRFSAVGGAWYKSPSMVMDLFYRQLQIPTIMNRKTGKPTSGAEAFEPLKKKAPWLMPILERLELLRSVEVFQSHFIDVDLMPNGRFGCEFKIGGTETFRWASSSNAFNEGTNLQNIPKPEED